MRNKQRGVTLMGLILWSVVLILLALLAMKLVPSYIEYFTIKKVISAISIQSRGQNVTPVEVRRSFENRSAIDDITSVKAADLEISKQGNDVVIAASYRREIPLFANIGVYIDFSASTGD